MSFVSYIYGGLSATTISGVTFYGNGSNLTGIVSQDTTITGGTYSSGTATFTNNTGGTFNVTGFYTGTTDVFVTGGTYSSGTAIFTNNTGGTFSVSGFSDATSFTGGTVNGATNFTNGLSANTISATTISGGTFYGNGLELTRVRNLVTVGLSGTNCDYSSIKSAVNSITDASATNTYVVSVGPGVFYEDTITMKSYIDIVGESATNTIIQANDPNSPLIVGADQSMVNNVQIQGCTGTSVAAVIYSSSTTPQLNAIFYVENVRFGANYTHVKNIGTGGGNSIIQCSNVKYGGYPFTLGFYCTNDGSGIGRMQLRNVTSTNGGVTTTTGLVFGKADKPGCGFIVNGCLLTKAVGAAAGTGFWVEDGGFLRLTGVNFQRWVTGIYAPQTGSAPSIDAIALNFENCTTDVEIIHSGATGKIQGTDSFLKTKININAPLYEVNTDPRQITVAKKGADFTSIKSAVDYLISSGNTSSTNRYVITVGPGVFIENEIDLTQTPYVSIVGSNIQTTQILPNTNSQHIIKIGINNEVSFLSLSGAPSGYAGIYCYDIGDFGQSHKVSFYDCDTNVWVESNTQDTKFYGEYVDFNGDYEYGIKVIGNNGYLALANMENCYNFPSGTGVTYCNYATGSGATISVFVGDNQSNGVSGSTAFYIQDGAELYTSTITADGFTYGIKNPNIGLPIRFDVDNASFINGEWDLYVERVGTFGTFGGSSSHEKIFTNSSDIYWAFLDIEDGEFDITRKASVTFTDGSHTDFTTLIFEGSSMGLLSGGSISVISGTTVQADSGFGYLEKSDDSGIVRRIDWSNNLITLSANTDEYIFINENGNLTSSGGRPDTQFNILLGRVITNSTDVEFIDLSPFDAEHTSNRFGDLFAEALGPIFATGSIVTEGTTPYTINVSSGDYFFATNQYLPVGGTGITFTQYYRNGTGVTWVTSATTLVNSSQYDNNGTLTGLTTDYFTKHTLYLIGDGSYENYFLVLGQNEYSSLVQAEGALLPTPPTYFSDSVTQIANIYIQEGGSGFTQVEDIRPTIAFRAGGVNASSVHGNLLGLGADDHTQYLLVSGTRAMSGNLDMGLNNITNVGTVDGVTVSAHATRHQFGGLDQVGTTTPTPNAIPYADVSGTLDSWVSTATTTTLGKVKLSTAPVSSSNPIAIGDNDIRVARSLTGVTYTSGTATFTNNTGGTTTITGFTTTNGSSPQVGFFSSGTNLTGSNNFVYSGGTLQVSATGASSSYNVLRLRNTGNTRNIFNINGDGSAVLSAVGTTTNSSFRLNYDWVGTESTAFLFTNTYQNFRNQQWTFNANYNGNIEGLVISNDLTGDNQGYFAIRTNNYCFGTDIGVGEGSPTERRVIRLASGVAPTTSFTDGIKLYSADIVAGNSAPHFRTEAGNIVRLYTHSAVTTTQGIANALTTLGLLSASTIVTPTDVFVTGGTYSSGTATFTNNTGGTFNVTGLTSVNGNSPQVGFFSSGTNLTGSNNFVYSGGTLQVRPTGNTSSDVAFRVRNSGDTTNLFNINGDGTFVFLDRITGGSGGLGAQVTMGNAATFYTQANQLNITGSRLEVSGAQTMLTTNAGQNVSFASSSIAGTQIMLNFSSSHIHLGGSIGDTITGTNTFSAVNGTIPTTSMTDRFLMYSNDIVAGNAAPHFRTESGNIVRLYTHSAVTTTQGIANALTTLGLLSASTISSGTDVFVTGATYNNNTFTYTNNTGGTFNVLFNTVTGLTINGNITVTGTSNLNGTIISTNLSGSTDRLVQVNSGGTFSATQDIIQTYIDPLGAVATLLSTTSNWDINGVYTGITISGTYQGQKHYDSNYFFEAVDDNLWIRLIRG